MPDFVEDARRDIEERLAQLREEVKRLEAAASALAGRPKGRGRARPRKGTARRRTGAGKRGRPRGTGTRAAEAERLVKANPGITIAELAGKMGIGPNYLYRVLPQLEKDKKVRKRDKGWHPAG